MTNATLTAPAAITTVIDPVAERASFFFDLEMAELSMTIPQAVAPTVSVQKY